MTVYVYDCPCGVSLVRPPGENPGHCQVCKADLEGVVPAVERLAANPARNVYQTNRAERCREAR